MASSWVDQFTCGAWGSLCATQNHENARIWGNRYGQLNIHPKYWPILSVDHLAIRRSPLGFRQPLHPLRQAAMSGLDRHAVYGYRWRFINGMGVWRI